MTKLQKPDIVGRVVYTIVGIAIVAFVLGVAGGVAKIDKSQQNVIKNCIKTDLVVLGGHNGTARYVYDCAGVDAK